MNGFVEPIEPNRRVLVVDDSPSIHQDFRKILASEGSAAASELSSIEAELFEDAPPAAALPRFELDSAYQGEEALEMVRLATERSRPYALAFVDMRMPPGWDGLETIARCWEVDPHLEVVICTAYSDHNWREINERLGTTHHLLILKKPFDTVEVSQLGLALTEKWHLARCAALKVTDLEQRVCERTSELGEAVREHLKTLKRLRSAQSRYERLFAALPAALIAVDEQGRIAQWNPAAEACFGLRSEAVLGKEIARCPIPWEWDKVLPRIDEVRGGGGAVAQVTNLRFDRPQGGEGLLDLTLTPMPGAERAGRDYVLLATDRTERRQLEQRLARAKKLEAIGQLAAGIAHEINTPLQFVGDNMEFLRESMDDVTACLRQHVGLLEALHNGGASHQRIAEASEAAEGADIPFLEEEIPRALEESKEGIDRVAAIVRAMKAFAHPGGQDKTAVDLNKALDSTITVSRNEWKYVAEIDTDLENGLPLIAGHAHELNQVFLNMIVNAAHAIAEKNGEGGQKGRIAISTRSAGPWVEVRIRDSGAGIPEHVRERIFDPFFTTKEVGKGTGQGLAIAHNVVVEKHQGEIDVDSVPGEGTTFRIRLPR